MPSYYFSNVCISILLRISLATLFLALPSAGAAASFKKITTGQCRVEMKGEIIHGDFNRLLELERHLIVDNGESTAGSLMCLDSPGGSVVEGTRIARFVLEKGVGTRIREEAGCTSMCAIIFMMGNARGSEVSFINRRIHVHGRLGFHRPYINLEEARKYSSGEIEGAYDLGLTSILAVMKLANEKEPWGSGRMMEPDLIQEMLSTPGNEMYYLTKVEEFLRWQIELDGLPANMPITYGSLRYVCEAALTQSVGLASQFNDGGLLSDRIFEFTPVSGWTIQEVLGPLKSDADGYFSVKSPRGGYASVGCDVRFHKTSVEVCGIDETSGVRVGDCRTPRVSNYLPFLATQHPSSDVIVLPFIGEDGIAGRFVDCRIIDTAGELMDDEVCVHEIRIGESLGRSAVHHLIIWPSGARTVIEIPAVKNGNETLPNLINGSVGLPFVGKPGEQCLTNTNSGNTICLAWIAG